MACIWDNSRNEVTCLICSSILKDPKILPCLHTFCKKCLQAVWDKSTAFASEPAGVVCKSTLSQPLHSQQGSKSQKQLRNASIHRSISKEIRCPSCFGKFVLSSTMIEELPTNSAALQLVELVTMYQQLSEEVPPACQLCDLKAEALCLQCNVFLCATCTSGHKKLKLTSAHQTCCLDDIKLGKVDFNSILDHKQEFCSIHPDKPLELFCKSENCFICLGCAVVKHRDHQYDFISQIVDDQKDQIKSKASSLEKSITKLEQATADVKRVQETIQKRRDENIKKIEQTFSQIYASLSQRKQQLVDEVNKTSEDRIDRLGAQQKQMEILCQQIKDYLKLTNQMLNSGRNQTILCMKKPIMDRNSDLKEQMDQTELTPVESVQSMTLFHTLDSTVALVKQLGAIPQAENCLVEKTTHINFCEFKLMLKDTRGQPVLGYAGHVKVFRCTNLGSDRLASTLLPNTSSYGQALSLSTPLQVSDAGNGDYVFLNVFQAYCESCHKLLESYQSQHQQPQRNFNKDDLDGKNVFAYQRSTRCSHCRHRNSRVTWSNLVSVQVDGVHIAGSPFDCQS